MEVDVIERWLSPGPAVSIGPGVVHVWRLLTSPKTDGDAALHRAWECLDGAERERASRVADDRARARFALTRAALRTALARYLGAAASDIELSASNLGKPTASVRGQPVELGFSVSHTRDVSLLAFKQAGRVGVDVEHVRAPRRAEVIANRVFAPAVRQTLGRVAASSRATAFLHAWTQREAYVKAIGGGMFQTEDPLAFAWPPPRSIEVQHPAADGGRAWSIHSFSPAPGHVATIVAEGVTTTIEYWSCD